jgi:hypothetical protein
MEQNLPEDYTQLLVSSALRDSTATVWDQLNFMWRELYNRNLAMVDVGGTTLRGSLANCFINIDPPAPWPTGAEVMSILSAIASFATAQFIEIEVYYLGRDEQGNSQLKQHTVGNQGLIYRICVLPTLRCVLVVGGNSREWVLRDKRTARLKTLVELISQLKSNPDELSERLVAGYEKTYQQRVSDLLAERPKPMIGVLGSAGVGKSTLLNNIMGSELLPGSQGVQSVTAFPTIIKYADIEGFEVEFEYNTLDEIKSTLQRLATAKDDGEESNPKDSQSVLLTAVNSGTQKDAANANQRAKTMLEALKKKDLTGLDVSPEVLYVLSKIVANELDETVQLAESDMVLEYLSLLDEKTALIKQATIRGRIDVLQHVDLVDLPGLGDIIEHRSQLTLDFVKKCNFLFYVRKERFRNEESHLYARLLDLQAQFAIIYTNFFNINDNASVRNLLIQNKPISEGIVTNFSRCIVAKHFSEVDELRKAGNNVESTSAKKDVRKEVVTDGTRKLSEGYTARVPIITTDSLWREQNITLSGKTTQVPLYLGNLSTIQFYVRYIANAFIKAHSDEMAEVMEQWFHSIRAARKKPVLEVDALTAVVKKVIDVNHKFEMTKLSSDEVHAQLNTLMNDLSPIQQSIINLFQDYNGHYVRGKSWSTIVGSAIDKSHYGINAALYRPVLHSFTQTYSPVLLETASTLVRQVLDYIDTAIRLLNKRIAKEMASIADQKPLEAQLAITLAKKVHDIPVVAKKKITSLLDQLLDLVHDNALSQYENAFSDSGRGVVRRVSELLSEEEFVADIIEPQLEYVANNFIPNYYEFLAQLASSILNDLFADTLRAFEPLTVGTPVTLDELMRHPHFNNIVNLLKNIAEDTKNLH